MQLLISEMEVILPGETAEAFCWWRDFVKGKPLKVGRLGKELEFLVSYQQRETEAQKSGRVNSKMTQRDRPPRWRGLYK